MTRFGYLVLVAAGFLTAALALVLGMAGMSFLHALLLGLNLATLLCYGCDKYFARVGGQRVPEAVLHILAAVGGTPGAFAGQVVFHHKTRDTQFRAVFFIIVALQVVALLALTRLRGP